MFLFNRIGRKTPIVSGERQMSVCNRLLIIQWKCYTVFIDDNTVEGLLYIINIILYYIDVKSSNNGSGKQITMCV